MFEKFEVIAISDMQKCASTLTVRGNHLVFNGATVSVLGGKGFIRPLINAPEHEFAIQVCEESDENAIKFVSKSENYALFIAQPVVLNTIRGIMGWDEKRSYKMQGLFVPSEHGIIYRMDAAVEVTKSGKKDAD